MLLLPDDIGSNSVVGIVGDIVFGGVIVGGVGSIVVIFASGGVVSGGGVVGGLRMIFGGQMEPLA